MLWPASLWFVRQHGNIACISYKIILYFSSSFLHSSSFSTNPVCRWLQPDDTVCWEVGPPFSHSGVVAVSAVMRVHKNPAADNRSGRKKHSRSRLPKVRLHGPFVALGRCSVFASPGARVRVSQRRGSPDDRPRHKQTLSRRRTPPSPQP